MIYGFETLINLCEKNLEITKVSDDENHVKTSYMDMYSSSSTRVLRKAISGIGSLVLKGYKENEGSDFNKGEPIIFNFRHLFRHDEWIDIHNEDLIKAEKTFIEIINKTDVLGIKESDSSLDYEIVF